MRHLSGKGLVPDAAIIGIYLVANGSVFSILQILTHSNAIFT